MKIAERYKITKGTIVLKITIFSQPKNSERFFYSQRSVNVLKCNLINKLKYFSCALNKFSLGKIVKLHEFSTVWKNMDCVMKS